MMQVVTKAEDLTHRIVLASGERVLPSQIERVNPVSVRGVQAAAGPVYDAEDLSEMVAGRITDRVWRNYENLRAIGSKLEGRGISMQGPEQPPMPFECAMAVRWACQFGPTFNLAEQGL